MTCYKCDKVVAPHERYYLVGEQKVHVLCPPARFARQAGETGESAAAGSEDEKPANDISDEEVLIREARTAIINGGFSNPIKRADWLMRSTAWIEKRKLR